MLAGDELTRLVMGLSVDFVVMTLILVIGYRPLRRGRDMMFMLGTTNVVVFGIAYSMLNVAFGVGAAFGLFALFGILRFRTRTLAVTEMSFLFASLALAVLNSTGLSALLVEEVVVINLAIVIALLLGARLLARAPLTETTTISYDQLNLLAYGHPRLVYADLLTRTGLDVQSLKISSIDLSNNTATIKVIHRGTVFSAGASPTRRKPAKAATNGQVIDLSGGNGNRPPLDEVPSTNGSRSAGRPQQPQSGSSQ